MIILDCTGRDLQRPDQPRLSLLLTALLALSLAALLAWPPAEIAGITTPVPAPTSPRVTLGSNAGSRMRLEQTNRSTAACSSALLFRCASVQGFHLRP